MIPNLSYMRFEFWGFQGDQTIADLLSLAESACTGYMDVETFIDDLSVRCEPGKSLKDKLCSRGASSIRFETTVAQSEDSLVERSVRCELRISPQHRLWQESLERRKDTARAWRNEEALGIWVRANGIAYPSVLTIHAEDLSSRERLLPAKASAWVVRVLESSRPEGPVRGFGEFSAHPLDFPLALAPKPWLISQLVDRFDQIHPILIAGSVECRNILATTESLGIQTASRFFLAGTVSMGLIGCPTELLSLSPLPESLRSFIVNPEIPPSTESLRRGSEGVRIGDTYRFSKRVYEKQIRDGVLTSIRAGWTLHSLILSQYCAAVGIDPEEMLVELMQQRMSEILRREIEAKIAALGNTVSHSEILQCHFEVYRKYFQPEYCALLERSIREMFPIFLSGRMGHP